MCVCRSCSTPLYRSDFMLYVDTELRTAHGCRASRISRVHFTKAFNSLVAQVFSPRIINESLAYLVWWVVGQDEFTCILPAKFHRAMSTIGFDWPKVHESSLSPHWRRSMILTFASEQTHSPAYNRKLCEFKLDSQEFDHIRLFAHNDAWVNSGSWIMCVKYVIVIDSIHSHGSPYAFHVPFQSNQIMRHSFVVAVSIWLYGCTVTFCEQQQCIGVDANRLNENGHMRRKLPSTSKVHGQFAILLFFDLEPQATHTLCPAAPALNHQWTVSQLGKTKTRKKCDSISKSRKEPTFEMWARFIVFYAMCVPASIPPNERIKRSTTILRRVVSSEWS